MKRRATPSHTAAKSTGGAGRGGRNNRKLSTAAADATSAAAAENDAAAALGTPTPSRTSSSSPSAEGGSPAKVAQARSQLNETIALKKKLEALEQEKARAVKEAAQLRDRLEQVQ